MKMRPEPLRKHLRSIGPVKLASYELMRAKIPEWITDGIPRPARPRAAALEQSGGACGDTEWDCVYEAMEHDQLQALLLEANENTNPNQLDAQVKNLM